MKLDATLDKILLTIQLEVKEKFNVELGIVEIHEVINNQIEATKLGFTKGITVVWEKFCKFMYTERFNRKIETIRELNKIDIDYDHLSQKEKEDLRREAILRSYEKKQSYIKKTIKETSTKEAKTVLDAKNISNTKVTMFNVIKKQTK